MAFDRNDPVQVQRLAEIVVNDAISPPNYNIGLSFVTMQDKEIKDEVNLERTPLVVGKISLTSAE